MLTVTIGVIAYNEENSISELLEDISKQDYNHALINIVLVDGMSTDRTKELMCTFAEKNTDFASIKIIDNMKRIQPAGLNCVIRNSQSDVIIRIDAHSSVPNDFVSNNVECIESGEDICGGQVISKSKDTSKVGKVVFIASDSMFGSGIAAFRRGTTKKYVKTTAQGCYKKEVFDKVGGYNENLKRSEDNEIHYRMRKAGYKICYKENIKSTYLVRASIKGAVKQKYGNGLWVGITTKITPKIFSLYHYIPFIFVMCALICAIMFALSYMLDISQWFRLPFIVGVSLYFLLDIALTVKASIEYREPVCLLLLPIIFPLLHFSYGIGTIFGFIKMPFVKLQ